MHASGTPLRYPRVSSPSSSGWAALLAILAVVNPRLLLSATTPTGGDMAAHVAVPAYLRDVLLPQGRILGWSQDWFAGYPVFYFYFPLPSLVIVLLDVRPALRRGLQVGHDRWAACHPAGGLLPGPQRCDSDAPVATVAAAGGAVFIFMESFTIYGANLLSTMAGEFSFSWSFALSLFYLASSDPRDPRRSPLCPGGRRSCSPGAVLCHIITIIAFMAASLTVLIWKGALRAGAHGLGHRVWHRVRSGWSRCSPGSVSAPTWPGFRCEPGRSCSRSRSGCCFPPRSAARSGHCGGRTASLAVGRSDPAARHLLPAAVRPA